MPTREGLKKHWCVVVEFANGAEIERKTPSEDWRQVDQPDFVEHFEYRVVKHDSSWAIQQIMAGKTVRLETTCYLRIKDGVIYGRHGVTGEWFIADLRVFMLTATDWRVVEEVE